MIDTLSGHGTFIAGLVHQKCPDADIITWRVVPSEGPIVEYDLTVALTLIADLAHRYRNNLGGGTPSTCSTCRWATTTRSPET